MISAPAARPSTAASPHSGGVFDSEGDAKRLADIEKELAKPDAWGNPEALTPVLQEKSRLEGNLARYKELKDCRDDMSALLELAGESEGARNSCNGMEEAAGRGDHPLRRAENPA